MISKIRFDSSAAKFILDTFGKAVNKDGLIVDRATGELIPSNTHEPIRLEDFAGIANGSEIYLKSDIVSLIEYVEKQS